MVNIAGLRKVLDKAGIVTEIREPDEWLSTGIYLLNGTMTNTFTKAIPNRRSVLFWGESGTGKSFILAMAAAQAQAKGYTVIYIDTETALDYAFLEKCGVNTNKLFMPVQVFSVAEATKTMSMIFKETKTTDKLCVIIDSLSNLETDSDAVNFNKGIAKGDQGQLAKQLKKFVKSVNTKVGARDMFLIMSGHGYLNQDQLNGEGKWIFSGGKGVQFLPSIGVLLTKLKLKDDVTKEVLGIKLRTEITKSRFAKLGGKCEIELDYEKGFESYAGMLDAGVTAGIITKSGGWYSYGDKETGEIKKFQRGKFGDHFNNIFTIDDSAKIPEEIFNVEEIEALEAEAMNDDETTTD